MSSLFKIVSIFMIFYSSRNFKTPNSYISLNTKDQRLTIAYIGTI